MALPNFPEFEVHADQSTIALRWQKWTARFSNLMVAMAIDDGERKKALLLHYAGEAVNDIFDTLSDAETEAEGDEEEDEDPCQKAIQALTNHFTPQRNTEYEVYVFRQTKQEANESITEFHTRLRQLARTCEFQDVDREIKTQIVQSCTSHKLRMKALENPQLTLAQLLAAGKAIELSKMQADKLEEKPGVNALTQGANNPRQNYRNRRTRWSNQKQDGGHAARQGKPHEKKPQARSGLKSNSTCGHCGRDYPHPGGVTACPAYGKKCRCCGKLNHFHAVCRSKSKNQTEEHKSPNIRAIEEENSSSEDEYTFKLNSGKPKQPLFDVKICDTPYTVMADSGASINVLDEKDYQKLLKKPRLVKTDVKVYPYQSSKPLVVLGQFHATIESKRKIVVAKLYVVKGSGGSLLSWKTSQELELLQTVQKMKASSSEPTELIDEFDELFHGLGKLKGYKVKLHIDESVQPVAQPHRRVPFHVRKQLEEQLKHDEELGVIEKIEGPTPWVSPIVVAPKPKSPGQIRVCVDMRRANTAIQRERHVTPTIREVIGDLNGAVVFSKLDLNQGYNQLEIEDESRYITTFSTHLGLMRYKRLNFGISSAAEIFQNAIRETLAGLSGSINISDDILVWGKSQEEHDENLRAVFQRLKEKGLTLNRNKCEFNKDSIEFFGYVFSKNGISPDPKKVDEIINLHTPTNASEVRSFLGMTNYCARFIPDYATISEPLRRLTHQNQPWNWSSEQDHALEQLKLALTSAPVTSYFNHERDTEISVDASPVGLGAVLTQTDNATGKQHVITYASRSLTEVEQRYSQTEREALAVVWACEHLHLYIYGKPVTVYSDHKPLVTLFGNPSSKPPARIERWCLRLQPYQLTLKYRRGSENPADYLSRHPSKHTTKASRQQKVAEEYINYLTTTSAPKALRIQDIEEETRKDPTLQAASEAIRKNNWHSAGNKAGVNQAMYTGLSNVKEELSVCSDYQIILRQTRIVIPETLQRHVVKLAHEGHQGIVKTKALVREKVWFPGIDSLVEQEVKSCNPCQASTPEVRREPLRMSPLPPGPWMNISVDFADLENNEHLLLITDDFSRFPVVDIVKSTSAKTVLPKLDRTFSELGIPEVMRTDNGPPFNGQEFKSFSHDMGFKHRKVTPRWPRANGEVERFVRTVKKIRKTAKVEGKNFKQELNRFLRNYRATPHTTTRIPPATLMFGRSMKVKLPEVSSNQPDADLVKQDQTAKSKMKEYADKKNYVKPSAIQPGDSVLVRRDDNKRKSDTPYHPEPYTVTEKKGSMVTAQNADGKAVTRNSSFFKSVINKSEEILDEVEQEDTPRNGEDDEPVITDESYSSIPVRRYPRRDRSRPQRFNDYVVGL